MERCRAPSPRRAAAARSEEHTSEPQSRLHLVCRLLLEKKKQKSHRGYSLYSVTVRAGDTRMGLFGRPVGRSANHTCTERELYKHALSFSITSRTREWVH